MFSEIHMFYLLSRILKKLPDWYRRIRILKNFKKWREFSFLKMEIAMGVSL